MKKVCITVLMILTIFLNIDYVKADAKYGPYSVPCDLITDSDDLCSYKCKITITENDDTHYIEYQYDIKKNRDESVEHLIKKAKTTYSGNGYVDYSTIFGPSESSSYNLELSDGKIVSVPVVSTNEIEKTIDKIYYDKGDYLTCPPIKGSISINEYENDLSMSDRSQFFDRWYKFEINGEAVVDPGLEDPFVDNCELFGENLTPLVKWALGIMRIAVALIFVVMTVLDFLKLAGTGEEKSYKDALNKFIKRLIIVVLIEVLPIIITILIDISGVLEQYNVKDNIYCSLF